MENLVQAFLLIVAVQIAAYLLLVRSPARLLAEWSTVIVPLAGIAYLFYAMPGPRFGPVGGVPRVSSTASPARVEPVIAAPPVAMPSAPASAAPKALVDATLAGDPKQLRIDALVAELDRAKTGMQADLAQEKTEHDKTRAQVGGVKAALERVEATLAERTEALRTVETALAREQAEHGKTKLELAKARAAGATDASGMTDTLRKIEAELGQERNAHAETRGELAKARTQTAESTGLTDALRKAELALGQEQSAHMATKMELASARAVFQPRMEPPVAPQPVAPAVVTPPAEARSVADSLKQQLDEGIDSPKLKVRLLPDRELVAGRSAAYYEITLLNRATSKRFTFEKERYVLVEKDFELQAMFEAFQSELLDSLPPGASHRLYVRGYASTADFTRSRRIQPTRGDLTHVSYLPASKSRGRFDGTESEQVVNGAVQNSDLPQIRAANIRALLNKGVPGAKLDIIAGALKPDTDPSVDSFDLILSVQWP